LQKQRHGSTKKRKHYKEELKDIKDNGLYKEERIKPSAQGRNNSKYW
jgi:hypothetical protein